MKAEKSIYIIIVSFPLLTWFISTTLFTQDLSFGNLLKDTGTYSHSIDSMESEIGFGQPIVIENLNLIESTELTYWNKKQFFQLHKGSSIGYAEQYYFNRSGKFCITIFYIDRSNEKTIAKVILNNQKIGIIEFGKSSSLGEIISSGINIQQWSTIAIELKKEGDAKYGIIKMGLTPNEI